MKPFVKELISKQVRKTSKIATGINFLLLEALNWATHYSSSPATESPSAGFLCQQQLTACSHTPALQALSACLDGFFILLQSQQCDDGAWWVLSRYPQHLNTHLPLVLTPGPCPVAGTDRRKRFGMLPSQYGRPKVRAVLCPNRDSPFM